MKPNRRPRSARLDPVAAAALSAAAAGLAQSLPVADARNLRPGELLRTLNSTPLGTVLDARQLRRHRDQAGQRISDRSGKHIDLVRYAAWLAGQRHKARSQEPGVRSQKPEVTNQAPAGSAPAAAADGTAERDRNAARMRESRAKTRVVEIPACADPKRRKRLEKSIDKWLRYYFADLFDRPFTGQQQEIIAALLAALTKGGDQAIAASRGEGKSTLAECVLIYCALTGRIRFAILFACSGSEAANNLAAIKDRLESNERLAADYPEVCVPIAALEHAAQRARTQLVSGSEHGNAKKTFTSHPTHFKWCGKEIVLPHVPGSPAAGAIIATRGLDAAVRGVKRGGHALRPDLVVIDDPEDERTIDNPDQAKKLERKIERGIAGLGGQKKGLARVMLTTCQRRESVSWRFTDRTSKPSWRGKRFRFLIEPPVRLDLWDEYVHLARLDWQNEAEGRITHLAREHYRKNRAAMDAGAIVANPYRTPDGELSALEMYYRRIARTSPEDVATELDNHPPEEAGPIESGISAHRVQRQLSGFARRAIPPGCTLITQGIDVRKVALHWVVMAWDLARLAIYVIDHGIQETHGTVYGSDEGADLAIRRAILARLEECRANPYTRGGLVEGTAGGIDLTLIDAGWQTDAVYSACAQAGLGVLPVQGFGRSAGCVQVSFHEQQRRTQDRRPGDGWFLSRRGQIWLCCSDADRWKTFVHERFMTAPGKPGFLSIFGSPGPAGGRLSDDERAQHSYAHHITAEVQVEEPVKGVLKRYWKAKSTNNHFLDATAYACVAANMKGFRLAPTAAKPSPLPASASQERQAAAGGWFASQQKPRSR